MVVNNYSAYMPVRIPVVIVIVYPDEIIGPPYVIYTPVIYFVPGPGKYFIILMPEPGTIISNISFVTLTVRPVERTAG